MPVGWLELPVTDGSLIALSTKVNAPAAPSSSVDSGFSRTSFTTARAPCTTKGAAAIVHPAACAAGRKPSAMCTDVLRAVGGSAGGDEALGEPGAAGPVQVQVGGVHAAGDEALGARRPTSATPRVGPGRPGRCAVRWNSWPRTRVPAAASTESVTATASR